MGMQNVLYHGLIGGNDCDAYLSTFEDLLLKIATLRFSSVSLVFLFVIVRLSRLVHLFDQHVAFCILLLPIYFVHGVLFVSLPPRVKDLMAYLDDVRLRFFWGFLM